MRYDTMLSQWWYAHALQIAIRISPQLIRTHQLSRYTQQWTTGNGWATSALFIAITYLAATHSGYRISATESWIWLSGLTVVSILSPWHTLLILCAYVLGDYFGIRVDLALSLRGPWYEQALGLLAPLPYYMLLYMWLIRLPQLALEASIANTHTPKTCIIAFFADLIPCGIISLGIFLWAQASALLIRPLWVWIDKIPIAKAIVPLQEQYWIICITACFAIFTRRGLLLYSATDNTGIHTPPRVPGNPWWNARSPLTRTIAYTALTTLFFGGMILRAWEAIFILGALFPIYCIREDLWIRLPKLWLRWVSRIPWLIRFVACLPAIWYTSTCISNALWRTRMPDGGTTFLPVILSVIAGLYIATLLLPIQSALKPTATEPL